MKKISNDENIKNLKKREYLRITIIFFAFLTIALAVANLFFNINLIFALSTFLIYVILNKIRDNIVINKKDDLKEVRNEIEKNKKKYGNK